MLGHFDVALFSCATGSASEPKSSSSNKQCFFKCVIKSGESFVEVINIARKLPFATLYSIVDAAHNVLDCLLIEIVFHFDLRRSGFDGIGTFNGLYIHLLRFTGKASGTHHLQQRHVKTNDIGSQPPVSKCKMFHSVAH